MMRKHNNSKGIIVALIVGVAVFITGCITEQNVIQNTAEQDKNTGLGDLCREENCATFCLNNMGRCLEYCSNNENSICKAIYDNQTTVNAENKNLVGPILEHIGIDLDFYDPATKKAGVFTFNKFTYSWNDTVYNKKVFYDYGEFDAEKGSRNPQPTYIAPLGTKVRAITTGVVSDVREIYSGDYTIMVVRPENPEWIYEHEHVINPVVNIGDRVTGGQIIAEVSDYNRWLKNDGYGVLEIGILTSGPLHHCPFMYLNESMKALYFPKITSLYEAWEEYKNDNSLYSEATNAIPGCVVLDSFP